MLRINLLRTIKGPSVLLDLLQFVSTICIAMKFKKLFALSLFAVLFESALVLGGYVENGQCEVIQHIMF